MLFGIGVVVSLIVAFVITFKELMIFDLASLVIGILIGFIGIPITVFVCSWMWIASQDEKDNPNPNAMENAKRRIMEAYNEPRT